MLLGDKKTIWIFAVTVSLLLHATFFLLLPSARLAKPLNEPKLTLSIKTAPRQPKAISPQQLETAAAKSPPKNVESMKKIVPAKPKTPEKTSDTPEAKPAAPDRALAEKDTAGTESEGVFPAAESPGAASSQPNAGVRVAPVNVSELRITKKVIPDYPAFSRKRKEEGTVKIVITIKNGAVTNAEISVPSGYERLDNSALRAVRRWKFGQTGEIRAIVPFVFSLTD